MEEIYVDVHEMAREVAVLKDRRGEWWDEGMMKLAD